MPVKQSIHGVHQLLGKKGRKCPVKDFSSFDNVTFSDRCHDLPELVYLYVTQKGDQKTLEMHQPKLNLKGGITCAHFSILSIHSLF